MLRTHNAGTLWKQLRIKGLLQSSWAAFSGQAPRGAEKPKKAEDDDTFELLPPGCSMIDPTYGQEPDTTVVYYDQESTDPGAKVAAGGQQAGPADDDSSAFELLPPGCSMIDPGYEYDRSEPTVKDYDPEASQAPPRSRKGKVVPATPTSRAAAEKQLNDAKMASEDEPYMYVPPGSSIRDPGYNSMSDPAERKVYYRDPPMDEKK